MNDPSGFDFGGGGNPFGPTISVDDILKSIGVGDPSLDASAPTPDNPTGGYNIGYMPGSNLSIDDILAGSPDINTLPPGAGGGLGIDTSGGGPGFSLGNIASGLGKLPWGSILPLLATLGGGLYAANRTRAATDKTLNAINAANAQTKSILGGNQALFAPYMAAGQQGLNQMMALPQSNLAARYKPLGTGAGFSLGALTQGR